MTGALPELAKGDCAKGTAIRFDFPEGWLELESATLEAGSTVQEVADLVPWATGAEFYLGGQTADEDQDLGIGSMPGDGMELPDTEQADPAPGSGDDRTHPVRIYGADYARENGIRRIVLLEGHRYRWKVSFKSGKPESCPVTTSFDPRRKEDPSDSRKVSGFRFVQCDRPKKNTDGWSGAFSVRNYFGCAFLKVADVGEVWFELVPRKVDYLLHFRAMMADLSGRAEEMLLDWSAPASQPLAPAPESGAVLIQQFNMLVNGIGTDRLRQWLRAVKRNPHRALASEARWEPASSARPDAFLKDPLRNGRDWGRVPHSLSGIPARGGPVLPQEILAHRKFDSFDTPPNRFVKFAIGQFAGICRKVLAVFEAKRGRDKSSEDRQWPAEIEAANLLEELESIRKDSFFDEVGALRSLPLNNQTLQKRHGYREILKAWTRVRRATKFKWEAFEEEFFLGDSRDVPTLYEYWVFFQLREVIGRIPKPADAPVEAAGIKPVGEAGGDLAFLQPTDEGGALNLKEGKTILCRYTWDSGFGNPLRLHLYFNRSFPASHSGPDEAASVARIFSAGSYSRIFDPDYTLVVFPERYVSASGGKEPRPKSQEDAAAADGKIAFLHFDAKYRVHNYDAFTGGALSTQGADAEEAAKIAKAAESAAGYYKTGDLIKMHCYNEAIRRTRGSYVIFPGPRPGGPQSPETGEKPPMFCLYHEFLPGVGAFRFLPVFGPGMQPSCDGQNCLVEFLRDVLVNQEDQFSQREAIEEKITAVVRERPPAKIHRGRFAPSEQAGASVDTPALVGFIRDAAAPTCEKLGLFYFYARKGSEDFGIPKGLQTDIPFLPYSEKGWLGWKAYVKEIKCVSRQELTDILKKGGMANPALSADTYFLASVGPTNPLTKSQITALDKHPTAPHRPRVDFWKRIFSPEAYAPKSNKTAS